MRLIARFLGWLEAKSQRGIDLRLAHAGIAPASVSPDRLVNWRIDPCLERVGSYPCCTCCCPRLCVEIHRDPCPNEGGAA